MSPIVLGTPLARLGNAVHRGKPLALCAVCHQLVPEREGHDGPVLLEHYAEKAEHAINGKLTYFCRGSSELVALGSVITIDWGACDVDGEWVQKMTNDLAREISAKVDGAIVRGRSFAARAREDSKSAIPTEGRGQMSEWVIVGREHSGDEDENVSVVEAFGPFKMGWEASLWLRSAPTFEGRVLKLSIAVSWLLDLLGVRLRDPNVNAT